MISKDIMDLIPGAINVSGGGIPVQPITVRFLSVYSDMWHSRPTNQCYILIQSNSVLLGDLPSVDSRYA